MSAEETRLAREEGQVEIIADILPYHWRVNPPGGLCSCGYETPLGRQTSEHVARLIVAALNRRGFA